MDTGHSLAALRAPAHEGRLAAFRSLLEAGPDGLAAGGLRERLDLARATLTAHRNVPRGAGLVGDTRADYACMDAPTDYLTENGCRGATCVPAAGHCSP